MRNVSKVNFLRKIPNQTLKAIYFAPTTRSDIEDTIPNYLDMTPQAIKDTYTKNWLEDHKLTNVEEHGQKFRYKDGTEDVYTKSGYEHDIFEYLDRHFMNKRKYRIITDVSHIDFMAGGRVLIDDEYYEVIKVINMTNDIPTQNKMRGIPYAKSPHIYAPKIIALI